MYLITSKTHSTLSLIQKNCIQGLGQGLATSLTQIRQTWSLPSESLQPNSTKGTVCKRVSGAGKGEVGGQGQ